MGLGLVKKAFQKVIKRLKTNEEPTPSEGKSESDPANGLADETELLSNELGLQDIPTIRRLENGIFAEILMSAGPRKEADTGLGEDASGLIVTNKHCFFWISDGTSESAVLEDTEHNQRFSSRVLAQDLGESFRQQIPGLHDLQEKLGKNEDVIRQLLFNSFNEVMDRWAVSLNLIQAENPQFLSKTFDENSANILDFSSTFLCGVLTVDGRLQVGCFGDSPFLVQVNNETRVIRPKNYRFFMRLTKDVEGHHRFITSNNHEIETYSFDEVRLVVAGSDGIGRIPELVKALSSDFSFSDIRRKFSFYDPRTKDDKALCVVSLEEY